MRKPETARNAERGRTMEIVTVDDAIEAMRQGTEVADATVQRLSYGLQYGEFHLPDPVDRERLACLRDRLSALKAARRPAPKPSGPSRTRVCSRCGCEVSASLAMTSSSGTVCPDCYDDASL